jgi:hypothetical protein
MTGAAVSRRCGVATIVNDLFRLGAERRDLPGIPRGVL